MPRIKDVDTVAPDDQIAASPTPKPIKKTLTPPIAKTVTPDPVPVTIINPVTPKVSPSDLSQKVYDLFGHTKTPFSSALIMPKVFNFTEKDEDETVLLAMRSHWFTNVPWVLTLIAMLFVPSLLAFIPSISLGANLKIIISFAWYLIAFAYSFEQFLSWYFDVYIVTNRRVVDIDFNNLLDKKFSEADLARIQDVTSRVSGVSQTILNYGTVLIQTAAEKNQIKFDKIPNPEKVVKILQDLRQLAEDHDHDNGGLE